MATRRRHAWSARLTAAALLGALIAPDGGVVGAPTNTRVNNPAGDDAVENGTHITQGLPAVAAFDSTNPSRTRFVAVFADTAGFKAQASGIGVAISTDGGRTWTDAGQLSVAGHTVTGTPNVAHDRRGKRAVTIVTACIESTKQCSVVAHRLGSTGTEWDGPYTVAPPTVASYSGHDVAVDNTPSSPRYGTAYATWSKFVTGEAIAVFLARSDDGGQTWSEPVQVSEEGESAFGPQVAMAPTGTVFVGYAEVARSTADPSLLEMAPYVGRSTDGATYDVLDLYPNATYFAPGSLFNCGTTAAPISRTLLVGNIEALDYPSIATNPKHPNDVYLTFSGNPPGADAAAVYFSRSTNGGTSFSTPTIVANHAHDQFFPVVDVAPDGTIGLFWYDRRNSSNNLAIDAYAQFSADRASHWGPITRVTSQSFGVPQLYQQYDTVYSNCIWPGGIGLAAPGSGFYAVWTDNRDRGPTANRGVDPNIYFAHPLVPTVLTATVAKTATRLNVTGTIAPRVTGSVSVTLYRRNSAGRYVTVSAVTRPLSSSGAYSAGFARPAAGSSRVITRFAATSEYGASTKTVTFSC